MRKILLLPFIITLFCFGNCHKNRLDSNGLPPATQSGKNTLGFLLNGQPWTPQGSNGTANLSIDVDFGYNNGIFNISAYRYTGSNSDTKQTIGFGVRDSLNLFNFPTTLQLENHSLFGVTFIDRLGCTYDYFDSIVLKTGQLTITKLDRINKIISGTFNAILSKAGCETINITEGRFDMRY